MTLRSGDDPLALRALNGTRPALEEQGAGDARLPLRLRVAGPPATPDRRLSRSMWPFTPPAVAFEQAAYGNFPFWDRGFDVHGRSPGCRPEWIAAFKETCQRLGDRPRDAAPPGGIVARSLADGTWLVIGPSPLGTDDRGRPDAVAFHGLFLDPREARRIGYRPFGLCDAFRRRWEASDVRARTRASPGRPSRRRRGRAIGRGGRGDRRGPPARPSGARRGRRADRSARRGCLVAAAGPAEGTAVAGDLGVRRRRGLRPARRCRG